MKRHQYLLLLLLVLLMPLASYAQPYTETEGRAAWARLQRESLSETTFRKSCDLIQDIGQTDLKLAYELLEQYVSKVRATRNRQWLHILLINWGKGKESLNQYAEADSLFRLARANARKTSPKAYCDALSYTCQLYHSWDKLDSLAHYLTLGEQVARKAHDRENLAILLYFRAASRSRKGQVEAMRADYDEAIRLATGLPNKNALFMARYGRASYSLTNLQQQVMSFDSLLDLAKDPSLARSPRFYERTTVYYRKPGPTLLFKLAQLNLLLADYDNAGRFADLFYDVMVRPTPKAPNVPYLNAEMAIIRVYQGQIAQARVFVDSSRHQFGGTETDIPYSGYFLAAGLLAEHDGKLDKAATYYKQALTKGATSASFSPIPPELFFVRALTQLKRYTEARQILAPLATAVMATPYSSIGLYYYQAVANLDQAEGRYAPYAQALNTYHAIRDSLTNLNQYRAVQQIMARVRIRDKEQQIDRLNAENTARVAQIQRERRFYGAILALALLTIGLLMLYLRNRQARARQREQLQQNQLEKLEQRRQLDLLQGVMEAEASERQTIADQLHNEVNPLLAVVSLNVSSALENTTVNETAHPKLHKAQDVLTSVSSIVRGISHRLTPQLIEKQGFKRAIDDLAESINLSGKVRLQAIVVGFDAALPVPFLSDLYRIVQELVQNILRHAEATEATVEVIEHDRHVTIMVEDNGIGIDTDASGDGQGLASIRAKVALRHGQMDVQRKPDGGTLVVIDNLELPHRTAASSLAQIS